MSDVGALSSGSAPRSRALLGLSPAQQVGVICVAMVCVTVVAVGVTPDVRTSTLPAELWVWFAICGLFAVFEFLVFFVQFRREGIVFSLSEIAIGLALVYLSPVAAIAARLVGTISVLVIARNNRGVKLVFNSLLFALEMSLVFPVFRVLYDVGGGSQSALLASIVLAELAIVPSMGVLTAAVISRYEGAFLARVRAGIGGAWWFYTINSVLSAMTVALALSHPALTILAAVPIGSLWFVMVTHGELVQQLRDLEATHGFAGRVGRSLELEEITSTALDETLRLMHADSVSLVRFVADGATQVRSVGDVPIALPRSPDDARWADLLADGEAVILLPADLRRRKVTDGRENSVVIVAPVDDGAGTFALLVVTRSDNQVLRFDEKARTRAQSLAEQLSSSLRKGVLHERLEWEARHDALTSLPSRTLFERYVTQVTGTTFPGVWGVMMLDLDRFKEVNDTLGHLAGDDLLVEFSRRMASILGPSDDLARLSGDEFAILCHRDSSEEIIELARSCVQEGGRPVTLDGLEIVVTVSVGVAEINADDREAIQPMRRADIAMYNAKWQRTGVEFYRDEIDRRTPARLSMLGDLRTAIETDQLTVVYQPKLDLATGSVIGAEALVRWDHPVRGTVPPSEFVRVAEDTGLIKQLTDLVLASGIRMLAEIQHAGIDVGLAVNLSTHDLFDARLPDRVRSYLDEHGVDPAKLTLEITESSLFVDAPRTRATIDGLYDVGLRMAVDDFGTGYSSLSYLRHLPVHELKIDQSFVAGMLVDPQDEVIVRSTVDLGHNLNLQVVAEGVESFEILARLREIGCDVAPGYAISQPILSTDIVEWLHHSAPRAWQSAAD